MDDCTFLKRFENPSGLVNELHKSENNYLKTWQAYDQNCMSEEGLLKAFMDYRQAFLRTRSQAKG